VRNLERGGKTCEGHAERVVGKLWGAADEASKEVRSGKLKRGWAKGKAHGSNGKPLRRKAVERLRTLRMV